MKSLVFVCVAMVLCNMTPSKTSAQRQYHGRGRPTSETPQDSDHVTLPPTQSPEDEDPGHSHEDHDGHNHENGDDFKPSDHDYDFGGKNHTHDEGFGTDWGDEDVGTSEVGEPKKPEGFDVGGERRGFRPRGNRGRL